MKYSYKFKLLLVRLALLPFIPTVTYATAVIYPGQANPPQTCERLLGFKRSPKQNKLLEQLYKQTFRSYGTPKNWFPSFANAGLQQFSIDDLKHISLAIKPLVDGSIAAQLIGSSDKTAGIIVFPKQRPKLWFEEGTDPETHGMPQIGYVSEPDANGAMVFLAARHIDLFGEVLVSLGVDFPCNQADKFPKIDEHNHNYENRVKRGNESLCRLVVLNFNAKLIE